MNFFMRQCTVAIKLLGNITRWQGVISDSLLSDIALSSLLNRYLLCAIRSCSMLQGANLCQMVWNKIYFFRMLAFLYFSFKWLNRLSKTYQ